MNVPLIRDLGMQDYVPIWERMQAENAARDAETRDEIWFLQHPPVFTLGLNGKPEHVLAAGDIPVVNIDRGGQVTYHGPGQIVVYPLLDLRRLKLGVRALVMALEQSVIDTLAGYGIEAVARR
ncbi:MAG TPA: lipoyl(octanoyl) transferase LipB, partial [Gammaproteobacteria bacterium]|nr:lipoyl(octanoyl) transferase LipB [Gammaproteobacteria bacterium]